MSITSKIYKGDDKIARLYKGDKKVLFMTRGDRVIYADWGPFTFNATGVIQTLVLPKLIKKIHVDCVASKGFTPHSSAQGGNGGRVQCDLAVNGGETLYIMVGGIPTNSNVSYNASDIRLGGNTLNNRIIVAGGGGSGCYVTNPFTRYSAGGAGGGTIGGNGTGVNGNGYATGGTQSAGGLGSWGNSAYDPTRSASGTLGYGGATGSGGNVDAGGSAGAGGAGYYGGGGSRRSAVFFGSSQRDSWAGSAGGGSSYADSDCSNVVHTQGYRNGAGYVTISFVE